MVLFFHKVKNYGSFLSKEHDLREENEQNCKALGTKRNEAVSEETGYGLWRYLTAKQERCPSLNTWSLAFFKIFLFLEVMSSLGDTEKSDKNGGSLRETIKKLATLLQFFSSLNQQINYHNRFEVHHKVVQQNNHLSLGKAGRGQARAHSLK